MEKVKEILELGQISKCVAIITTGWGRQVEIPWKGLEEYFEWANYEGIEFISASAIDEFLLSA